MRSRYRNFVTYGDSCSACCNFDKGKDDHKDDRKKDNNICALPFISLAAEPLKPICSGEIICLTALCDSHDRCISPCDGGIKLREGYYLLTISLTETSCCGGTIALTHCGKIFCGMITHFSKTDSVITFSAILPISHCETKLMLMNLSSHPLSICSARMTVVRVGP